MQVFHNVDKMQQWSQEQKRQGKSIGLVPTMGSLHQGHLSLVKEAGKNCDIVIVSIFVNPIQFCDGEDYEEYPRDVEKDKSLLEDYQVDAIFAPLVAEMYPSGYNTFVELQGEITQKLCGKSRVGHFRGVSTVVSKLFNICLPDKAFFGQKDAQQAMIIEKMVRELNFPLTIVRVPIVRESDGLAMSSRNIYLNKEERKQALVLNKSLKSAKQAVSDGERKVAKIKELIRQIITESSLAKIDYVEIFDAINMEDIEEIEDRALIALAVKFGDTRLIDNLLVEV